LKFQLKAQQKSIQIAEIPTVVSKAQFFNLPSEYFSAILTQKNLAKKDSSIHSSIQPYIGFFSNKYESKTDEHKIYKYVNEDEGVDAVFYNHVVDFIPKNENFI
jgi:hypothetical protein